MLWRSSELSRPERIALTAVLAGYAVHNLFVFDNLYSYIYFFAILPSLIFSFPAPPNGWESPTLKSRGGHDLRAPGSRRGGVCAPVWAVNISGMRLATKLITAQSRQQ